MIMSYLTLSCLFFIGCGDESRVVKEEIAHLPTDAPTLKKSYEDWSVPESSEEYPEYLDPRYYDEEQPVPEPSTVLLFASGLTLLFASRKMKEKR